MRKLLNNEYIFFGLMLVGNLVFDKGLILANDFILPRIPRAVLPFEAETFFLTCLFTQLVMLAIWSAMFSGSNLVRVLLSTLALIVGVYFLLGVDNFTAGQLPFPNPAGVGICLFILTLFYLVQIPLWALRKFVPFKIAVPQAEIPPSGWNRQLSLKSIFAMMTLISVLCAIPNRKWPMHRSADFKELAFSLLLFSIVIGIPYLWALLAPAKFHWRMLVFVITSELFMFAGSRAFYHINAQSFWASNWLFITAAFRIAELALVIIALANGLIVRAFGYRLVGAASAQIKTTEISSVPVSRAPA